MNDEQGYTPIDCGLYSEYELAIMHKRPIRLHWQDEAGEDHVESIMPKDLKTADKREYLIAERDDGSTFELRLDRILKAAVADA
ncbi:MAG: Rho-binding antiterminator [Pseudomonadota bacterium]